MNPDPRLREEYSDRQVEAARRVLIDIGQILSSYKEYMVIIGGWVPDLLLEEPHEPHVGSIDVDIALDAARLTGGLYADLLNLLLGTRRYEHGERPFQLISSVSLEDGELPVRVEVEFLAPAEAELKKNRPKLVKGFRVLQTEGCSEAFRAPIQHQLSGANVRGVQNTVELQVASLPDFLVLKALAIGGRDKPKDSYDFCYTLEHLPAGLRDLAQDWAERRMETNVARAINILRGKFESVRAFGPQQVVEFYNDVDHEIRAMQARRSYELVQALLSLINDVP